MFKIPVIKTYKTCLLLMDFSAVMIKGKERNVKGGKADPGAYGTVP